ncbi:hypothetical protein Ancab_015208 [Ancistrocladus abbreviatus]
MVGLAIVCAHGAFRVPEDLFLDEQEPAATGFLSFLGGAARNAAAAAAPAVTSRVKNGFWVLVTKLDSFVSLFLMVMGMWKS